MSLSAFYLNKFLDFIDMPHFKFLICRGSLNTQNFGLNKMIKNEAEILSKCSQYLSIKGKFFNEMNSFYDDKRKIAREIEIFNTDPPPGMSSNQIKSVLENLEKLTTRRNALNIKEKDFFEDLESMRKIRDQYISIVQGMEKTDNSS